MMRRFLLIAVTAFLLTACGSGTDPVTIKRINSNNGVPLIEFTYTSQQALRSFLKMGELQVVDGTGFCREVEGVTGTATVPPAAPAPGDVIVIAFADCVDENGITFNNSIRVTINSFTDWTDLSFTLEFIDLTAEADWFDGIAAFTGTLDYVVAGNAGSIVSTTFEAAVPTGIMGRLTLASLDIIVTEDSGNPDYTRTDFNGDGEIANTQIDMLNIRIRTNRLLGEDTADANLRCPKRGSLKVIANADDSFASILFPEETDNVYQIGTNLSFKQHKCP